MLIILNLKSTKMRDEGKLYETMGELLYAVAKADGVIQNEEKEALQELLKNHKWKDEINWSFNYEASKNNSVEEIYSKVITVCERIGPSPLYKEFIEAMTIIANANNGIDDDESKVMNSFSSDLIERFRKDTNSK